MRFARVRSAAAMLAAAYSLSSGIPTPCQSRPRTVPAAAHPIPKDPVRLRLLTLGARGLAIEQAREHVIAILNTENSCSAWFREADPDVSGTFESLDFTLHDGPKYVVAFKSAWGGMLLKHPYSAAVQENAGHNATVLLNVNGPFFENAADILERNTTNAFARVVGRHALRVGSFDGNTLPARITTLLHELGHVIGLLPDDSDEMSGLSKQNTERVLHVCRAEIKASAREPRDTTLAY